mmetsp:Transcript_8672/g.6434  ORF Transcript_8672/g.6434 Transcript_8672/m.6434 type:complete len:99 (+) Transcript_8672:939-1235(+)
MFTFCLVMTLKVHAWTKNVGVIHKYIFPILTDEAIRTITSKNFLFFYLVLSMLLPTGIYLVLEAVKLSYTRLVEIDVELAEIDYSYPGGMRLPSVQNS